MANLWLAGLEHLELWVGPWAANGSEVHDARHARWLQTAEHHLQWLLRQPGSIVVWLYQDPLGPCLIKVEGCWVSRLRAKSWLLRFSNSSRPLSTYCSNGGSYREPLLSQTKLILIADPHKTKCRNILIGFSSMPHVLDDHFRKKLDTVDPQNKLRQLVECWVIVGTTWVIPSTFPISSQWCHWCWKLRRGEILGCCPILPQNHSSSCQSWSTGDDYQPLTLDLAMQRWLTAGGVRRVCSGHLRLALGIRRNPIRIPSPNKHAPGVTMASWRICRHPWEMPFEMGTWNIMTICGNCPLPPSKVPEGDGEQEPNMGTKKYSKWIKWIFDPWKCLEVGTKQKRRRDLGDRNGDPRSASPRPHGDSPLILRFEALRDPYRSKVSKGFGWRE